MNYEEIPLTFDCDGATLVGMIHRPEEIRARGVLAIVAGGPQYRGGVGRLQVQLARTLAAQAVDAARQASSHPAPLAHTLNRLGNWYLNVGQPQEALRCHQEALTIFQELNDAAGLAQTYDLLGLMIYLGGNPVQGAHYLQQAIALFQQLRERQSLASSLTTLAICGPGYSTDSVVPARIGRPQRDLHV